MKPGSCAFPYFGIEFVILDPATGVELLGPNVEGVLCLKRECIYYYYSYILYVYIFIIIYYLYNIIFT